MTIDELTQVAAGTLMVSFVGPEVPGWVLRWADRGLGGVCLFGSNLVVGDRPDDPLDGVGMAVEQCARLADVLHGARPSLVVALDEEGGVVTRLEAGSGSSVPGSAALGVVDDLELTRDVAAGVGRMLRAAGVDLDLAPCADVNVDVANPAIGVRSFGADPELVARHVGAFVDGLQGEGVAACAKHFPGHGATSVDSHLELPVVAAPLDVLRSRELVPFRAAVDAGVAAVMTAHLRVPALGSEPATVSRRVLADLLRDELGFRGVVVTDALDMQGIGGVPEMPANVVRALQAGADLCCLGPRCTEDLVAACVESVVDAVHHGEVDEQRLHDAAQRTASLVSDARDRDLDATDRGDPAGQTTFLNSGSGHLGAGDDGPLAALQKLGREAARRALRVEGVLPDSFVRAHVVEVRRAPMMAEGVVPWGVGAALRRLDPTATSTALDGLSGVAEVLAEARRRPLVIVVRDPQGRERTAQVLAALVAGRPDAVVVDMGWPDDHPSGLRPAARICTFGSSRASGEAVAELLAGGGSARG